MAGWTSALAPSESGPNSGPGVLAGSHGGDLVLLDLPGGTLAAGPWRVGPVGAAAMAWCRDRPVPVAVTGAGYLVTVDLATDTWALGGYTGRRDHLVPLALPRGPLVALDRTSDGEIWSLESGATEPLLRFPVERKISGMAAMRLDDHVVLAVATESGQVTLWRLDQPDVPDAAGVRLVRLAEHRIAIAPADDPPPGARWAGPREPGAVCALSFGEFDGAPVLVAAVSRTIQGWTLTGEAAFGPVVTDHRDPVLALLAESPDGTPVVWSTDGHSVQARDTRTGAPAAPAYQVPPDGDAALMLSVLVRDADRILVVNGYGHGGVRVHAALAAPAGGSHRPVTSAAPTEASWDNSRWYPKRVGITAVGDRSVAFAMFSDGVIRAFDLADGADVAVPPVQASVVAAGERVWLGRFDDGEVCWFDPAGGAPLGAPMKLWLPTSALAMAAAEVDGRPTLVASDKLDLRRFDVRTGERLGGAMTGHKDYIHAIAVARSGGVPIALSCANDDSVRLWDLRTGRQIGAPLSGHGGKAYAVATVGTGDGGHVAFTAGESGEVRLYDLAVLPGRLRHRRLAGRTVLRVGRPVQSLAAFALDRGWVLAVASQSRVTCLDMDGAELAVLELDDNVTDLAAAGDTFVVTSGTGVYALNPLA
jgi:WD40 repeat protein